MSDRVGKTEWERMLVEQITDEMLTTPIEKLSETEVALLQAGFSGPYSRELTYRLDEIIRRR